MGQKAALGAKRGPLSPCRRESARNGTAGASGPERNAGVRKTAAEQPERRGRRRGLRGGGGGREAAELRKLRKLRAEHLRSALERRGGLIETPGPPKTRGTTASQAADGPAWARDKNTQTHCPPSLGSFFSTSFTAAALFRPRRAGRGGRGRSNRGREPAGRAGHLLCGQRGKVSAECDEKSYRPWQAYLPPLLSLSTSPTVAALFRPRRAGRGGRGRPSRTAGRSGYAGSRVSARGTGRRIKRKEKSHGRAAMALLCFFSCFPGRRLRSWRARAPGWRKARSDPPRARPRRGSSAPGAGFEPGARARRSASA